MILGDLSEDLSFHIGMDTLLYGKTILREMMSRVIPRVFGVRTKL